MKTATGAFLLAVFAIAVGGCAGGSVARNMCEGLQLRVRVVDPLADPKSPPHPGACAEYETERSRLEKAEAR